MESDRGGVKHYDDDNGHLLAIKSPEAAEQKATGKQHKKNIYMRKKMGEERRQQQHNNNAECGANDDLVNIGRRHNKSATVGTPRRDDDDRSGKVRQFVVNFVVIIGVAVSWALAVQFRKSTLVIDPNHFYAPFSLVWFSTLFITLCLPVFLLYAFVSGKNVQQEQRNALKVLHTAQGHFGILHSLLKPLLFLALWTSINYAYAQALGLISAGAASSIMSASTALVWILGWILLRERFSALKFVAVLLAMAGVVVVAMDNEFAANNLGICLAILSTVIAAFYKVLFKLCVGNASLGQVSLFMTVLGVLNLVLNTMVAVVLLQLGFDHIEWDHVPWSPLIGSALLGLVFNFLLNFGIALLDPLVVSIGMLFGMPLSACIDFLFRALPISAFFLVGSLLITISFVLIAFPIELGIRKMFCSATANNKTSAAESIEEESSSEKECEETPFHH